MKVSALDLYRALNPKSRAVGYWTFYGSTGCRTIATCVFCRKEIITCSAKYPVTKRFWSKAASHICGEMVRFQKRADRLNKIIGRKNGFQNSLFDE